MNPFPLVLADLRRNRPLAWLIVLLVALALAVGIMVISQERALRQGSARAADDFDLLIGAPGSPTQLVLSTVYLQARAIPLLDGAVLAEVARSPGVVHAAPIAFGDHWQGHPIVGTTADFASRGGALEIGEGRIFQRRGEAVVGAAVPLAVGARIAPQHGHGGEHDGDHEEEEEDEDEEEHAGHADVRYTVVGRLPARHTIWDTAVLVPVEDVWAIHGQADGHDIGEKRIGPPWNASRLPGVPAIAVKPASVADAYVLRGRFRAPRSLALFPAEALNELYAALGNARDLMSLLAVATQVLVVAAVLVTLLTGFLARRRRFAVLRAIGAPRRYVFATVWIEVAWLIGLGALLGLLLGYGAAAAFSRYLQGLAGFAMRASLGVEEFILAGSLALSGGVLAILPAWWVFRRSIVDGLTGPH
ncbi:MAG: FtsX-like permease family protein [Candidatus Accumulibacter sp.]|jgi:putative ABC transport system permease protein|nr:FtsX-like permease family protein [Accumulibacter sp.]